MGNPDQGHGANRTERVEAVAAFSRPDAINPDVFGETPLNQSPPFSGYNLYDGDPLLVALGSAMPAPVREDFAKLGASFGAPDSYQLAQLANTELPVLRTHDERGRRIDRVDYHPAYHSLMRRSIAAGLAGSVWQGTDNAVEQGLEHQARAIRFYVASQVECGHLCPLTMTNAAPAALRHNPALAAEWLPLIRSRHYDPGLKSFRLKTGVTIGMAMTEKQGGTDVGQNVTRADPVSGDFYSITGHKWFMSAPMCDAFLVLAKTGQGLSCFFMPRFLPDGSANRIRLQRLKNKLGNCSNASSEVEFHGAGAFLVGAEGHGARTILEMVTLTRLDCALASAGMMRAGLTHAVHHSRHRHVFDRLLIDQPIAARVMADLALDCAAATVLSMRLAEAFDRAGDDPSEALFARLMTPVVKYWVCKAAPPFLAEAMECLGGNGYTEDWPLARFYREAPLNAIWEGSGNVMCLDVLRVLRAKPEALDGVLSTVNAAFGRSRVALGNLIRTAANAALADEGSARFLTEQMALTVAAAELQRIARPDIADAFLETRLGRGNSTTYGMLDSRFDARSMLEAIVPTR